MVSLKRPLLQLGTFSDANIVVNHPLLPMHAPDLLYQATPPHYLATTTPQKALLRLYFQANLPSPPSQQHPRIPRLLPPCDLPSHLRHIPQPLASHRHSPYLTPQPLFRRRSHRPRPPLRQNARLARNRNFHIRQHIFRLHPLGSGQGGRSPHHLRYDVRSFRRWIFCALGRHDERDTDG